MIQEKLSQAFDQLHQVSFGEDGADEIVVQAGEVLQKELQVEPDIHKSIKKLDEEKTKALLTLDIMRVLSSDKGVTGLAKALDALETQNPTSTLSTKVQTEVDTIGVELTRQANKFQAELGGDSSLMRQIGILVKEKKWGEASSLIRKSVAEAQTKKDITLNQASNLNKAIDVLESNDLSESQKKIIELDEYQRDLRDASAGEIPKQLDRVDKLETAVARRYVELLKEVKPSTVDVDPRIEMDTKIVKESDTKAFIKKLSGHPDISAVDVRRLQNFQEEAFDDWSDLDKGVDIEKWSRSNEDRQRYVREAHGVASHILFLEKKGDISLTSEQRTYIKEIQRATSATRRAWAEEMVSEGEKAGPTDNVSPEELKDRKARVAGVEQLIAIKDAEGLRKNWEKHKDDPEVAEIRKAMKAEGNEKIDKLKKQNKIKETEDGQLVWIGSADDFFEEVSGLARDVAAIVPEVNQIPFSRSPKARLYQRLMESEAPPSARGELAWAKDAVFRLYTMGYVKEALWKNGGDVESFSRAALGLLGQGGDESVYSSLNRFHEKLKVKSKEGNAANEDEEIFDIDLRDLLDYSEQYAENHKKGLRSWLNVISAGELNSEGDATSQPARKEFFYAFMDWKLRKQLDMAEITKEDFDKKIKAIGSTNKDDEEGNARFEALFDVYGEYYTNLTKVMQAIHLRYGQVAVNQSIEPGSFEFCSPPGGEAAYKLHKNTVFKFVTRYVPNNKFGAYLDGKVDMGMTSTIAYARGETMPHFVSEHSVVKANPGADEYFFGNPENDTNRKKYAKQFVEFWKPAMFDYEDHALPENAKEPWKNVRPTDDLRMIADVIERANQQLNTMSSSQLEFVKGIDYSKLSVAMFGSAPGANSFEKIFVAKGLTDPKEKFRFMINNFGYKYFEWNGLRSKRIGDLYAKYIPKNFAAVYGAAIKLGMNATNDEYIFEAATNIDAFTGGSNFIEDIDKVVAKLNKRNLLGIQLPETSFAKGWANVTEKGERTSVNLNGKKESTIKNLLTGQLPRNSIAGYHLRHRDPDWMRPFIWEAAYQGGQMSPEVFEKKMKDYKGEMYFGPVIGKVGKLEIRAGAILPILPMFLLRGWFVDKLHLDTDDFWWITSKANKELWESVKKAFGFK